LVIALLVFDEMFSFFAWLVRVAVRMREERDKLHIKETAKYAASPRT
jgi:hypothetical protein